MTNQSAGSARIGRLEDVIDSGTVRRVCDLQSTSLTSGEPRRPLLAHREPTRLREGSRALHAAADRRRALRPGDLQALEAGALAFLPKPFGDDVLLEAVTSAQNKIAQRSSKEWT